MLVGKPRTGNQFDLRLPATKCFACIALCLPQVHWVCCHPPVDLVIYLDLLCSVQVDVNGPDAAPVYQFLRSQKGGGILGDAIKWNFGKFLVDKEGKVVERYAPTTDPSAIEVRLGA